MTISIFPRSTQVADRDSCDINDKQCVEGRRDPDRKGPFDPDKAPKPRRPKDGGRKSPR